MSTIHARPNLNGNTHEDFQEASQQLFTSVDKLRRALSNIRSNVTHGRNYQTVATENAREIDTLRITAAFQQAEDLAVLAHDIFQAAKGGPSDA